MRILFGILLAALLGWFGWWWAGAVAQERAMAAWFKERAEAGWQAEYGALAVDGFPMRFERRVEDLVLTDPGQGWSVRAPWIRSESQTFGPNRFTVTAAPEFSVAVPGESVRVRSGVNQAGLAVVALPSMPLDDAAIRVEDLTLEAADWSAGAKHLGFTIARKAADAGPENSYALAVDAEGMVLPEGLLEGLRLNDLSPEFERLAIDADATLDHAIDRDFVEEGELSVRTLVLRRAALRWDEMAIVASGRIDADTEGFAEGTLDVGLTNWKQMIRVAERAGAIGPELAGGLETALGLASVFSSRNGTLELPVKFGNGRIYLGPVGIGDAPRIAFPPRVRGQG